MANFYTNQLTVAAPDKSMMNVLRTTAHNLKTREAVTGFSKDVDSFDDVDALYKEIYSLIDNYYWLVFTPYKGKSDDSNAAMQSGTDRMSDTAVVTLLRHRQGFYVLTIKYDTRWGSNEDEVSEFTKSLPKGEYGIALFGAGEGDGYENTFIDVERITEDPSRSSVVNAGVVDSAELLKEKVSIANDIVSEEDDMATVAYKCALSNWDECEPWEDSPELSDQQIEELRVESHYLDDFDSVEIFDFSSELILEKPLSKRYEATLIKPGSERMLKEILGMIKELPARLAIPNYAFSEQIEILESLLPGMKVKIRAGYNSLIPGTICPRLYTLNGQYVGYLNYVYEETAVESSGWLLIPPELSQALVLLAPFLKVTVADVTPKAFWVGVHSSVPPKLVVDVELAPIELRALVDKLEARIEKTKLPEDFDLDGEGELPW